MMASRLPINQAETRSSFNYPRPPASSVETRLRMPTKDTSWSITALAMTKMTTDHRLHQPAQAQILHHPNAGHIPIVCYRQLGTWPRHNPSTTRWNGSVCSWRTWIPNRLGRSNESRGEAVHSYHRRQHLRQVLQNSQAGRRASYVVRQKISLSCSEFYIILYTFLC